MVVQDEISFTKVKNGKAGVPGPPGENGQTQYTHIAYANSEDGKMDFSTSDSDRDYVGIYVDFERYDSTNPGDYAWSKIKGAPGEDGFPGKPGENGKTPYFHVAYANSSDGQTDFSISDSQNKAYIGQYTDYTPADSTKPSDYHWTKIKGEKGRDGEDGYTPIKGTDYFDGEDGQDGRSSYLWVRYSQFEDGSGMTTDPTDAVYTGIATTEEGISPTDYRDYTWQKTLGKEGVPGEPGSNGQTSYLHIKYSNDGGQTFTSNEGETPGEWIGQYVDFTKSDSSSVTDYTWSKVKGDPTGLTEQNEIPVNPYEGMLWKNTGNNAGYISGATYRFNGSEWEIFTFRAENISADTIETITSKTGSLDITDWLTFTSSNYGLRGTYDYGDPVNNSFIPRWYEGDLELGYRRLAFWGNVYEVNSDQSKGKYLYYTETYFAGDQIKLRQYTDSSTDNLKGRIDMTASMFQITNNWSQDSGVMLSASGDSMFTGKMSIGNNLQVTGDIIGWQNIMSGRIDPNPDWSTFQINENFINGIPKINLYNGSAGIQLETYGSDKANLRVGGDGTGPRIYSQDIRNRTYSFAANMFVTSNGTLGMSTSASKYKLNINPLSNDESLELGNKLLTINPSKWWDKAEVENYTNELTSGDLCGDYNTVKSHYGLIAEDLEKAGLDPYVSKNEETGEIVGIEYDRLWTVLIPVIKQQREEIEKLKMKVGGLEE